MHLDGCLLTLYLVSVFVLSFKPNLQNADYWKAQLPDKEKKKNVVILRFCNMLKYHIFIFCDIV